MGRPAVAQAHQAESRLRRVQQSQSRPACPARVRSVLGKSVSGRCRRTPPPLRGRGRDRGCLCGRRCRPICRWVRDLRSGNRFPTRPGMHLPGVWATGVCGLSTLPLTGSSRWMIHRFLKLSNDDQDRLRRQFQCPCDLTAGAVSVPAQARKHTAFVAVAQPCEFAPVLGHRSTTSLPNIATRIPRLCNY